MAREFYIDREFRSESHLFRRILILVLAVVLVAAGAFGYLLLHEQKAADETLLAYSSALSRDDFAAALPLYREVQEKSLSGGLFGRNKELYNDARVSMEALTGQRLTRIENQLRANQPLSAADLRFAAEMGEVTGQRLAASIRTLCEDYLSGRIELPVLQAAINQLASLENLKVAIGGLPEQIDKLKANQPAFIQADKDLKAARFLQAASVYQGLANAEAAGSVVRQFAAQGLDETRKAMYTPLLADIDVAMAGSRFVSAAAAIDSLQAYFPDDAVLLAKEKECQGKVPAKLVKYSGTIEHIAIKPLIANPAAAFDGDSYAKSADDSMLTTTEFGRILEALRASGFVLIDATRLANAAGKPQELLLPEGKKPLVLTIEGLNYYAARLKTGNCDNIVLNEAGQVCGRYTDAAGKVKIERGAEAIGILDTYVEAHPEFSFDGAKGTISLTGYECVFGYITDADQLDDRNPALTAIGLPPVSPDAAAIAASRETVAQIMKRLRDTGWIFASSTYGSIDARSQDMNRITSDTEKWLAQVGSLTGPVRILHYPNGSFIAGSDPRARYLMNKGFTIFGGLGVAAYQYAGQGYLYVDKTPLNGFTLRNAQTYGLSRFFANPAAILDAGVRPKK